ncbi:MAG: histidinol-phosphate transaminase [Halodesulfurarchaeum sp.]
METRDLEDHVEYVAGRGIEEVARDLGRDPDEFVKLASNENPFGPSEKAVSAIRDAAGSVHHYPKAVHTDLTAALAEKWHLDSEQVWLAPGGDGALDYLARAMIDPGDRVLVPRPGFAYYGMSARYHHGAVDSFELSEDNGFALTADVVLDSYSGHRIVYLTSPHNPTGRRFTIEAIRRIASGTDTDTLVVVDEAYAEFADGPSARTLLEEREDVAVLRTFSKAYGLAGLRVGYALVPSSWAGAYSKVNTPFATNALACRAGREALEDDEHVTRTVETVRWSRSHMADHLDAPVLESHGNFVLVEVGDASSVTESLLESGVIVRDCSSFGLPAYVRVTCGTESETKRVVRELNTVLSE